MGGGMSGGMSGGQQDNCDDCVELKVSSQKVTIPCTRNVYKQYTVKVPRQVREKIPRTMKYTTMETRKKTIPYTVNKTQTRYKNQMMNYREPVTRQVTKMVTVKTKEPRTMMVDVCKQIPKTQMQTKQIP